MRFASYNTLNALLLLIPLYLFLRWAWKKRIMALQRFGNLELVERLMEGVSRRNQKLKLVLIFLVFALSLLALARPLWGQKEQEIISRGHDIIIALDVSKSMLAEDIKPNRLARAKLEISNLIDRMQGNRIGLVIFAGEAFTQCPLTLDYAAAKILLEEVEVGSIPIPGTAISKSITKSLESFPPGERESRVIILITDGEDTVQDPISAAEKAAEEGVMIYAIGIGNQMGQPIPIRDEAGNLQGYVQDSEGNVINSKLDVETLRNICQTTNGAYYNVQSADLGLNKIYEHMEQRRQQKLLETRFVTQFEERFEYFLLPALICLLLEMLLSDRKRAPKRTVGGYQKNELHSN